MGQPEGQGGYRALAPSPLLVPHRWMLLWAGCWIDTVALNPLILWKCSRVRSSLQPLSGALMWMLVGLSPPGGNGVWHFGSSY